MKRAALILAVLMLFSLAACGTGEQNALSPTAAPTEAVTEAPTEVPTEAPTEEPTAVPTASPVPETPDFSGLIPQTGKLCEGPIFPEPAKYLVISGEGDNFYVYDNMGELVKVFNAVEDDYAWGGPGLYGEDGICENVRISTGEHLPKFQLSGDRFVFYEEDWENYSFPLLYIADEDLNTIISFPEGERPDMGYSGGVLFVDGRMLVLSRSIDYDRPWGDMLVNNGDIMVYDMQGNRLPDIDPEPFGHILGVFGDKYIIGGEFRSDWEDGDLPSDAVFLEYDCTLFDLEGNKVMEHVIPVWGLNTYFSIETEGGEGALFSLCYLRDEKGKLYGADLEPTDHHELYSQSPLYSRYGALYNEMEELGYCVENWDPLYSGVRRLNEDGSRGEWTFRIYNPKLVSDHDNGSWW